MNKSQKSGGLSQDLSSVLAKAILPVWACLLALGLVACGGSSTTEETPVPGVPGLVVSELTASDELGDFQRRFSVRLSTSPTATVEVTPSASGVIFTPTTLEFTSTNYATAQEVIVTNAGITSTTLAITLSTSSTDTVYNSLADVPLSGTVSLTAGLGALPLSTATDLGSLQTSFRLHLTRAPSASVTVALSSNNMGVSFSPSSLTFTSTNWNTAQEVTLTLPDPAPDDHTITLISTSTDTAYQLTRAISGNLSPLIEYSLHVHNARTPEPESPDTRSLDVWFTLHPTDSVPPTALSDITIIYTVGGGTATGGTSAAADYMSSATGTAILLQGTSMINITIPILGDSTDTVDETFTVTIMDATASAGGSVTIADNSAIVTIGEPESSAIYFFPNRPLAEGDAANFECFVLPETNETFVISRAPVSFDGSTPTIFDQINANETVDGLVLTPYTASVNSLLFDPAGSRPGVSVYA